MVNIYLVELTTLKNHLALQADESAIELKVPDVSGEHKVKISSNITQK
jgi:hypothetical protein